MQGRALPHLIFLALQRLHACRTRALFRGGTSGGLAIEGGDGSGGSREPDAMSFQYNPQIALFGENGENGGQTRQRKCACGVEGLDYFYYYESGDLDPRKLWVLVNPP